MPNLHHVLRIIGWLLAMAIALAASSASVVYAYRYGTALAASEPEPWLTGLALAIGDSVFGASDALRKANASFER